MKKYSFILISYNVTGKYGTNEFQNKNYNHYIIRLCFHQRIMKFGKNFVNDINKKFQYNVMRIELYCGISYEKTLYNVQHTTRKRYDKLMLNSHFPNQNHPHRLWEECFLQVLRTPRR